MYKDKDKQREADRERQRRRRDRIKAKGVTNTRRDSEGVTKEKCSLVEMIEDKPKRGKEITCFADLPPDVQASIRRLSHSNEEARRRTQIAIKYQRQSMLFQADPHHREAGGGRES